MNTPTASFAARLDRRLRTAAKEATAADVIVMACLIAASIATPVMFGASLRPPTFQVPATFISGCDPTAPAAVWDVSSGRRTLISGDPNSCTQGVM